MFGHVLGYGYGESCYIGDEGEDDKCLRFPHTLSCRQVASFSWECRCTEGSGWDGGSCVLGIDEPSK